MKISFNPSNSNKNILDLIKNNKDIIFDLKGHSIFARGVEFKGTDTNTWRPVVDNLTSDSTTSSLSAKQGKVLKALIDGKSNSDHNHDGRYVRYYTVTALDCNNLAAGLTAARVNATNAGTAFHSAYLYISDVGTPFQIQIPDSGASYIYKRYYSSGKWSGWFKLNAGYADSAGSVAWANVTGKPSSYTPSAHTHAWNSLTHSSTTENQAILTNGSANGWKLQTLNIARWDNAANNAHSHANKSVLDGITSALVNSWNTAYNFVSNITGTDTDKVINKWEEIVNFLAGITEDNKLNTLLSSKLSVYELADKTNVGTIKNNGIYYSTTDASSSTLTNSPFNKGFALINMTSYDGGDDLRRSRLAFNAYGEIKVSDDRDQANTAETWYNVLTSKNSGINGSTIKLNGTSITVYSSGTADGRYVKKSGDTMSGVLTIDTTNFGTLTIKRNDDANGASIQFRGKSSVYGYIGLNNSTKDKQFLRWNSDTSRVYTILDTSSTYISNGKGVINGTTITQVDNSTNARKLVNWYSARPTSLNAQFGDGSLRIFYATSSTTVGKPAEDSHILHLAWDTTGGWDAQLAVRTRSGKVSTRAQNGGTWQPWKTLAFTTDIPSSLKNPYSFNVFGVVYDGSAAKTVTTSTFISQVNEGTSTITDGTMLITSYASNSGFADTNAANVPYKRKAIHLWEYIQTKTDSLYATKGHNHDGRYLKLTGGWMSGDINFGGDNKIYWGRNTDSASISFKNDGDGDANSYMSFVTSDNGNEYFRWSHSSGSTNTEWMALRSDGLRVRGTKVSLEGHSHNDLYYTKVESNAKYITDIATSVNKLTFTRNGSNIARNITVNVVYSQGNLTNISNKDNTTKASSGLYIYNSYNQVIGTNSYSSVLSINTGGTIQIAGNWGDDQTRNLYWRSQSDRNVANYPWKSWRTILDSENYSFTLDSRYYTESEVNSLLSKKLNTSDFNWTNLPGKLVAGNEFNIVNAGFNGAMWFNYLPINDRNNIATINTYCMGNGKKNLASVTASGFIKTGSSSSYVLLGDGGHKAISDFASSSHSHNYAANENYGGFTKSGRLPISGFYQSEESENGGNAPWTGRMHLINCQHSNTNNNFALQIAASFFDNNTFKIRVTDGSVNNSWRNIIHSGNISIQSVNYANSAGNADTVDGYHATDGRTFTGRVNWSPNWNDTWSDSTNKHPWYGFDNRYPNTGEYSTTISDYYGMTIKTYNTLRLDCGTLLLNSRNNVGIGTTSPTQKLDVVGNIRATGQLYLPTDGNYNAILMGNDCWMGDCNISNVIGLSGTNNANSGGIKFGKGGMYIGYNGSSHYSSGTSLWTNFNADTVDGEHASNFSYTHQSSFDFSKRKSGRIVTFDQPNTDYGWINGFASTYNNYLTSVIFNTHRTSNWYVGYMEGDMSTGETNGLQAVHKLAFADGDVSYPIFLGYLNLYNGNDGTMSSSFPCLGYSVPFTYTRGGAYCLINIPDTSFQTFYIKAAIASVHYSGAGMDYWVGNHRGEGAWWLHCDAIGNNAVRVKGFHPANGNNDSWWGGNPLYSGLGAARIITVCLFGYVKFR